MTDPALASSFLAGEVDALEPFGFVAVIPGGRALHVVEITRTEGGSLQVRVPGRPRTVPELPQTVRASLRERGFASEDASDPTHAWAIEASDAKQAVSLMMELLAAVFEEKADVSLDIGHGSHKSEHEAEKNLELARKRIEAIVTETFGRPPDQDSDGDYVLPIDDVHVMVAPRAAPEVKIVVRVFAVTNVGVNVTPDLGLFLSRLNFGLTFGRFALDTEHHAIWFDETLLGEKFREEELTFAIRMVASTADSWDDRLKQMFGGATYQEVLAGRTAEPVPPTKPGEGHGLYL